MFRKKVFQILDIFRFLNMRYLEIEPRLNMKFIFVSDLSYIQNLKITCVCLWYVHVCIWASRYNCLLASHTCPCGALSLSLPPFLFEPRSLMNLQLSVSARLNGHQPQYPHFWLSSIRVTDVCPHTLLFNWALGYQWPILGNLKSQAIPRKEHSYRGRERRVNDGAQDLKIKISHANYCGY